MPPDENENVDTTAGDEIVDTAGGWTQKEDWDAAAEVTEPVTDPLDLKPTTIAITELAGSSDEPTDAEIAAAEAILARRKQPAPVERDPDAPVSDKPIPIRLIEDNAPLIEAQTRVMIGDMEIIGTAEKIEYVKKLYGVTQNPEAAVVAAVQPMNPMITAKITAEQEAGRRALAARQAQAVSHPRLPKTPDEIERDKPAVTIFRGSGADIQQHLLRQPAVTNKGPGY